MSKENPTNTAAEYFGGKVKVDPINPPHYMAGTKFEAIKIIEAYSLSFNKGNILKYLLRAGFKVNEVQDLEKAMWYLKREIKNVKAVKK